VKDVLFVELLGGFGDLLLALPAVHALALSHPGARVHVATFDPGGVLLERDPLVASCRTTDDHTEGAPRAFVAGLLAERPYDLAVTTTTYDGIGDLLRGSVPVVADRLWRSPPPDELVDERFLRLLAADGLVRPDLVDLPLRLAVGEDEVAAGRAQLGSAPPVLLLPDAGMQVKTWAHWPELVQALPGCDVVALPGLDPAAARQSGARLLTATGLRGVAGLAAAVAERGGVVVGADTGPVRLAAAAGARTVGLYGPTLASRYGTRTGTDLQGLPGCPVRRPTAITEQECWWSARCPLTGDRPACMDDLAVEQVAGAVRAALG
jgi:ADP-heptose:LPS heptosyltransferase